MQTSSWEVCYMGFGGYSYSGGLNFVRLNFNSFIMHWTHAVPFWYCITGNFENYALWDWIWKPFQVSKCLLSTEYTDHDGWKILRFQIIPCPACMIILLIDGDCSIRVFWLIDWLISYWDRQLKADDIPGSSAPKEQTDLKHACNKNIHN